MSGRQPLATLPSEVNVPHEKVDGKLDKLGGGDSKARTPALKRIGAVGHGIPSPGTSAAAASGDVGRKERGTPANVGVRKLLARASAADDSETPSASSASASASLSLTRPSGTGLRSTGFGGGLGRPVRVLAVLQDDEDDDEPSSRSVPEVAVQHALQPQQSLPAPTPPPPSATQQQQQQQHQQQQQQQQQPTPLQRGVSPRRGAASADSAQKTPARVPPTAVSVGSAATTPASATAAVDPSLRTDRMTRALVDVFGVKKENLTQEQINDLVSGKGVSRVTEQLLRDAAVAMTTTTGGRRTTTSHSADSGGTGQHLPNLTGRSSSSADSVTGRGSVHSDTGRHDGVGQESTDTVSENVRVALGAGSTPAATGHQRRSHNQPGPATPTPVGTGQSLAVAGPAAPTSSAVAPAAVSAAASAGSSSAAPVQSSSAAPSGPVASGAPPAAASAAPGGGATPGSKKPQKHHSRATSAGGGTSSGAASGKWVSVNGREYMPLKQLGAGGSATVWSAIGRDMKLWALKIIKVDDQTGHNSNIKAELKLLERLRGNPNVIQMHDYEEDEVSRTVKIVLEKGETDLAEFLRARRAAGMMDLVSIKYYWQEILRSVQACHEAQIIHNDLKLSNFVLVGGSVKIIDFGISKALTSEETTAVFSEERLGTVNYMPPESLAPGDKSELHRSADVWALGCILYEITHGKTPFAHLPLVPKIAAITNPAHKIPMPDCDSVLQDVLQRCLNRNPRERPTVAQLLSHPFLRGGG